MKPWIQNVSMKDVLLGTHRSAGKNSMLIQIVDPDSNFPKPKDNFDEIHQFKFFDLEEEDTDVGPNLKITAKQAKQIVKLLKHALINDMSVIVHCHAGLCRSGAVAEVGVMMGFNDTGKFRLPNKMVKKMLIKELGWGYS